MKYNAMRKLYDVVVLSATQCTQQCYICGVVGMSLTVYCIVCFALHVKGCYKVHSKMCSKVCFTVFHCVAHTVICTGLTIVTITTITIIIVQHNEDDVDVTSYHINVSVLHGH